MEAGTMLLLQESSGLEMEKLYADLYDITNRNMQKAGKNLLMKRDTFLFKQKIRKILLMSAFAATVIMKAFCRWHIWECWGECRIRVPCKNGWKKPAWKRMYFEVNY